MAIPKKGSRKIVVDGSTYRWLIRKRASYDQVCFDGRINLAIELDEKRCRTLIIYTDRTHPNNIGITEVIPVTPADIENWIREAHKLGWQSNQVGPQMHVVIEEGRMVTQEQFAKRRRSIELQNKASN